MKPSKELISYSKCGSSKAMVISKKNKYR